MKEQSVSTKNTSKTLRVEEGDFVEGLFEIASNMAAMSAGICVGCRKEPAEDGLYCFTCAKIKHDIEIDRRECGSGDAR